MTEAQKPKRVWVVHGRNKKANKAMYAFLRALRLDPYEWPHAVLEQTAATPLVPQIVNDVIAKSPVVIVLLTGDEVAHLRGAKDDDPEGKPGAQPRQNVLIEAGLAMGLLPGRVFFVRLGNQRPISNLAGAYITSLTDVGSRKEFADRLARFLEVDTTGAEWKDEGDFEGCIDKSPLQGPIPKPDNPPEEVDEEGQLEAFRREHKVEVSQYAEHSLVELKPGRAVFVLTEEIAELQEHGHADLGTELQIGTTWEVHKLPNDVPVLVAWTTPETEKALLKREEGWVVNYRTDVHTRLISLHLFKIKILDVERVGVGYGLKVVMPPPPEPEKPYVKGEGA